MRTCYIGSILLNRWRLSLFKLGNRLRMCFAPVSHCCSPSPQGFSPPPCSGFYVSPILIRVLVCHLHAIVHYLTSNPRRAYIYQCSFSSSHALHSSGLSSLTLLKCCTNAKLSTRCKTSLSCACLASEIRNLHRSYRLGSSKGRHGYTNDQQMREERDQARMGDIMMCEAEVFCKTYSLISALKICVALLVGWITAPRRRAPQVSSSSSCLQVGPWASRAHCCYAIADAHHDQCGTVPGPPLTITLSVSSYCIPTCNPPPSFSLPTCEIDIAMIGSGCDTVSVFKLSSILLSGFP